jgi:hypothetical protein
MMRLVASPLAAAATATARPTVSASTLLARVWRQHQQGTGSQYVTTTHKGPVGTVGAWHRGELGRVCYTWGGGVCGGGGGLVWGMPDLARCNVRRSTAPPHRGAAGGPCLGLTVSTAGRKTIIGHSLGIHRTIV